MIRFHNGKVLTFEHGAEIAECEVWTDGGEICYVGPKRDDDPDFEREIDLKATCSCRALRTRTPTQA